MNDKLQKQDAKEYVEDIRGLDFIGEVEVEKAFIAGAESRQAEIDELKEALRECARVWNMPVEARLKPYIEHMKDAISKAEQILKKYEK